MTTMHFVTDRVTKKQTDRQQMTPADCIIG